MAIIDGVTGKLNGANDLVDKKDINAEKGWIAFDADGNGQVDDDVWINKDTGEVYLGDNSKGTINIDAAFVARAKTASGKTDWQISDVILDDDDNANVSAKVNISVDIGRLLLDNDALTGGIAKAEVNLSGQTGELKLTSDMDAAQSDIATKDTKLGVDVDLGLSGGENINFSGSNDIQFTATNAGAEGLDVQNNFDINNTGAQATISGTVAQNILDYKIGTAQDAFWDWNWMKAHGGSQLTLTDANSTGIIIGQDYNGKGIVNDVKILAHSGVELTFADGHKEIVRLGEGAGQFKSIAVYDPSKGTLVQVADKVYTWANGQGVVTTTTMSTTASTSTSTSTTTSPKVSDPLNHFGLTGNINATALDLTQKQKGVLGNSAVIGADGFLTRNEVVFSGGATMDEAKIHQDMDLTVEGNNAKVNINNNSGNWINGANKNTEENARILWKGSNEGNIGGLAGAKISREELNKTQVFATTFKDYKTLITPVQFEDIIAKLHKLNKAATAEITEAEFTQAAKDAGVTNLTDAEMKELYSIYEVGGEKGLGNVMLGADLPPAPAQG